MVFCGAVVCVGAVTAVDGCVIFTGATMPVVGVTVFVGATNIGDVGAMMPVVGGSTFVVRVCVVGVMTPVVGKKVFAASVVTDRVGEVAGAEIPVTALSCVVCVGDVTVLNCANVESGNSTPTAATIILWRK